MYIVKGAEDPLVWSWVWSLCGVLTEMSLLASSLIWVFPTTSRRKLFPCVPTTS